MCGKAKDKNVQCIRINSKRKKLQLNYYYYYYYYFFFETGLKQVTWTAKISII